MIKILVYGLIIPDILKDCTELIIRTQLLHCLTLKMKVLWSFAVSELFIQQHSDTQHKDLNLK